MLTAAGGHRKLKLALKLALAPEHGAPGSEIEIARSVFRQSHFLKVARGA